MVMTYTYRGFADKVRRASAKVRPEAERLLIARMELMKELARSYPGNMQPGWAQLSYQTQARKNKLGYGSKGPLMREGTYRDSINIRVTPGLQGVLYSQHKGARLFELGGLAGSGSHMPPRTVILRAAAEMRGVYLKELNELLVRVMEE